MTLLLSAVTPEGIAVGADSALTWRESGDQINLVGFNKIVPVSHLHLAVATAGSARIGPEGKSAWISTWLRQFATEVSTADSFSSFCNELTQALNDVAPDAEDAHTFQVAAWAQVNYKDNELVLAPRLAEVTRTGDAYAWGSKLSDEFLIDVVEWRKGSRNKGYPITFVSSGLPPNYATWIAKVGTPGFSQLLGIRVPEPQIMAVAEYVRFLVRTVAELYRISRQPAYVGEPVETLVLLPESKNMFAMRY